ncbi:MAG: NAD(P)/FAD-dependent oxidoreductase, partial [Candidatus Sumerlaeia bacterium]|nr:NAD(P)/FAD-dependent oxidoreductase [Candidatus Sumerlaeia bacterium]
MKVDAVIIGAGVAGLHCAQRLAQAGAKVIVIEKNNDVGNKPCAGGITAKCLRLGIPIEILERIFSSCIIHYRGQKKTINTSVSVGTTPRQNLAKWQYRQAFEAGAEIIKNCQVEEIRDHRVITSKGVFEFEYLIGADGSNSLVRRVLRLPVAHFLYTIHYEMDGRWETLEWFIEPCLFKNGFGWIFPFLHQLTIGAGGHSSEMSPKQLLRQFYVWLEQLGMSSTKGRLQGGLINVDYRGWRFNNNIFLIGDAAGLASPLTGEGIYSALLSADEVAQKIITADYK